MKGNDIMTDKNSSVKFPNMIRSDPLEMVEYISCLRVKVADNTLVPNIINT